MRKVRILLVDQHELVRAGIRELLGREEGIDVVGEVGNEAEALDLIGRLRPAVVLLEPAISGGSGLELLRASSARFPLVYVIAISVNDSFDSAAAALRAGAAGYLPKSGASVELGLAIAQVMSGRKYLSPSIGPELQRKALTPRQGEVLKFIAEGYSTKEIAFELKISVKTVETHRALLMDRLDIHDVAGLVRFAIKRGLVSLYEVPTRVGYLGRFLLLQKFVTWVRRYRRFSAFFSCLISLLFVARDRYQEVERAY